MVAKLLMDADRGLKKLLRDLETLGKSKIKVGIQGPKAGEVHRGSALTMVELGTIHEYGAPAANVPQRSFLRGTLDENPGQWSKELDKQTARVAKEGANPKQALMVVAEKLRTAVLDRIDRGIPPPLKDATIARKGGETTPLIDTGALRGSITATVGEGEK